MKNISCPIHNLLPLLILLLWQHPLRAQFSSTIESSRPGQALGPRGVGAGVFQVQGGFDFAGSRNSDPETNEFRTNHFLRLGIGERIEINGLVEWKSVSENYDSGEQVNKGFSPQYLGITGHLVDGDGWIPSVGLHTALVLPTGPEYFRPDHVAPQIMLLTQNPITFNISFTTNLGLSWDGFSKKPGWKYVLNMVFNPTDQLGTFIENYGYVHENTFSTWFDGGLAWLVNGNLQLDILGGCGKNEGRIDFFLGLGFSWRIYNKNLYDIPVE